MDNNTIYKTEQINILSSRLGVSKVQIRDIITAYVDYLRGQIAMGRTIKFLNICYLVNRKYEGTSFIQETDAFIATELARSMKLSEVLVQRVFQEFEDTIVDEVVSMNKYTIRGLFTVRVEKDNKGIYRVRTKKSTAYAGDDIYVTTLNLFKRKVNRYLYDGKNA